MRLNLLGAALLYSTIIYFPLPPYVYVLLYKPPHVPQVIHHCITVLDDLFAYELSKVAYGVVDILEAEVFVLGGASVWHLLAYLGEGGTQDSVHPLGLQVPHEVGHQPPRVTH